MYCVCYGDPLQGTSGHSGLPRACRSPVIVEEGSRGLGKPLCLPQVSEECSDKKGLKGGLGQEGQQDLAVLGRQCHMFPLVHESKREERKRDLTKAEGRPLG